MKKRLLLLVPLLFFFFMAKAQIPVVSIQDIQTVPAATLASCVDTSAYQNDTVTVRGVVVMDGGLAQAASGRNIWIQNGTGPFSGLDVYTTSGSTTTPDDILNLIAGDSVEITGTIISYQGETEIDPLSVTLLSIGLPVQATVLADLSDLNDNVQVNQLPTGEQWEGSYVEVNNVTVVDVQPFSGGNRVSFIVEDALGNKMNVSDRFLAQRLPANGGTFVPPNVGTVYCTLRGVIMHSANGCAGGGRGYEMHPFSSADYIPCAGTSAPLISNITRNPITPSSSQDANISATIEDVDGTVTGATLYYAIGVSNNTYTSVPMTNPVGDTWTGAIPNTAYSDGDFVKYYICALDDDALSACQPDVPPPGTSAPLFFAVRDNGTTIYDVQFTPYTNGNSGYRNMEVTLEGVITASAEPNNLGFVFMQQEGGLTGWSGIMLLGNTALAGLEVGDKIQATGTVREDFGFTRLEDITNVVTMGTGTINPVTVNPGIFSTYDFLMNEAYEGMLVSLENPGGGGIYIVDANADAPSNFAEYRVGTDVFDPNNGARVLTGRVTSSAFGSLNVSYVNDSIWATNSGIMNVPVCVVEYNDTMTSMTGIMYYSFSNFKILPRNNDDVAGFSGACNAATGIEDELAGGSDILVWPNPANEILNLRYAFPRILKANVALYDMMGRKVATESVTGTEGEIRMATGNLAAGAYLLTVESEGTVFFRKKMLISGN